MKIEVLTTLLILSCSLGSFAQTPYYDAVKLSKYVSPVTKKFAPDPPQVDTIKSIFKYYQYRSDSTNPFLKEFMTPGQAYSLGVGISPTFSISKLSTEIGGLNVTNIADGLAKFLVERVKEELTISFFQKFKDDLNGQKDLQILFPTTWTWLQVIDTQVYNFTSYITLLREAFIKDLQMILPNLEKVINDSNHKAFFDTHKPLKSLFITALIITKGLKASEHAGDILHDVAAEGNFDDFKNIEPNLKPSFQTLDLLVQSLRSNSTNHYLVPWDSVKSSFFSSSKDLTTFNIYLGLLYQQSNDSIYFKNDKTKTLKHFLKEIKNDQVKIDSFKASFQNQTNALIDKANIVHKSILKIKNQNKNAETKAIYSDYYQLYDATLTFLESASSVPQTLLVGGRKWQKEKGTYFFVARKLGEIYLDVNQKNYASAILSSAIVYDTLFGKLNNIGAEIEIVNSFANKTSADNQTLLTWIRSLDPNDKKKTIKELIKSLNESIQNKTYKDLATTNQILGILKKETGTLIIEDLLMIYDLLETTTISDKTIIDAKTLLSTLQSAQSTEKTNNTIGITKNLLKYGNFAAQIAAAENSDQVQAAIEAVALPAGSSRIKRETPFNVALNGYLGFFGGWEKILSVDNKAVGTYGITAPVGISISRGHSIFFFGTGESGWKKGKCAWSTSLFISIIDIGALASYRATQTQTSSNDTTTTTPQIPTIQFKNIISPGAFISLGIPKCPLSINLGAQVGPNLRSISVSSDANSAITNNYADQMYWRFSVSLVADIPILNLYTKSK